jgi:hypothetical protein
MDKLSLNLETLRRLNEEEAQHVEGARPQATVHTACNIYDCGGNY